MRKPKDFDTELKALNERARELRARKLQQLGELVVATGADALPIDALAGALLCAAEAKDDAARMGWRVRGAAYFQRTRRKKTGSLASASSAPQRDRGTLPLVGGGGPK
jgi:hypothetical protein